MEYDNGFAGFIDNIKQNPVVLGAIGVVVLLAIYFIHRSINKTGVATPAINTANPPIPITYNNTYNQYPTIQPPPDNDPVAPPVVIHPGLPPVPIVKQPTPPPKPVARYYTVKPWPQPGSSLWSIAQIEHESLSQIEALNPQIKNFNLIYPGQQVRIS